MSNQNDILYIQCYLLYEDIYNTLLNFPYFILFNFILSLLICKIFFFQFLPKQRVVKAKQQKIIKQNITKQRYSQSANYTKRFFSINRYEEYKIKRKLTDIIWEYTYVFLFEILPIIYMIIYLCFHVVIKFIFYSLIPAIITLIFWSIHLICRLFRQNHVLFYIVKIEHLLLFVIFYIYGFFLKFSILLIRITTFNSNWSFLFMHTLIPILMYNTNSYFSIFYFIFIWILFWISQIISISNFKKECIKIAKLKRSIKEAKKIREELFYSLLLEEVHPNSPQELVIKMLESKLTNWDYLYSKNITISDLTNATKPYFLIWACGSSFTYCAIRDDARDDLGNHIRAKITIKRSPAYIATEEECLLFCAIDSLPEKIFDTEPNWEFEAPYWLVQAWYFYWLENHTASPSFRSAWYVEHIESVLKEREEELLSLKIPQHLSDVVVITIEELEEEERK